MMHNIKEKKTSTSHKTRKETTRPIASTSTASDSMLTQSFYGLLKNISPANPKKKTKRKTESAEVITASPYKRRLIAELQGQKNNKGKKLSKNDKQKGPSTSKSAGSKKKLGMQNVGLLKRHYSGPINYKVNYYCIYCNELYVDPPSEEWIQCWECKQWAHEGETDYEGIGHFVCDECR